VIFAMVPALGLEPRTSRSNNLALLTN